ncbi:MAG: hypothetical protein ACT4PL_05160 [Phycisphaerales bacterium]
MAMSIDVRLPRDQVPLFPSRCVRCGKEDPDYAFRLKLEPILAAELTRPKGVPNAYEAPACRGCARWMKVQAAVRMIGYLLFLVLGCVVYFWLVAPIIGHSKLYLILFLCVSSIPCLAYTMFRPRPLVTTEMRSGVDYEFADREYALEFAVLNHGEFKG